jgi:Zn-dependent protease
MLFSYLASCFVSIAVFNIIPVHPLCGNRILKCFLSPNAALKFSQNEKILQMVVIFLLLAGWLRMPLNAIVSKILTIPVYFLVG